MTGEDVGSRGHGDGTDQAAIDERDAVGIEPPAVTVIGEVAALRNEVVDWLADNRGEGA